MSNIYQKMSDITNSLPVVGKSYTIDTGTSTYNAVSEVDVLNAVKEKEREYGVFSYPAKREFENVVLEKNYVNKDGVMNTFPTLHIICKTTYRFVNLDDPTDFIEVYSAGDGLDGGDKGIGKAMTYADKYALMKAYKICSGVASDPDAFPSPPLDDGSMSYQNMTRTGHDNPMLKVINRAKENPMQNNASQDGEKKAVKTTSASIEKPKASTNLTLEDAKNYVLPCGTHKGMTFGEVLANNEDSIKYYATKFQNDRYPEIMEYAKMILASRSKK